MVLRLVDCLIVPITIYGCKMWLHKTAEKHQKSLCFEKLNMQICKYILNVNRKTAYYACLGELGRYPLWVTAKQCILGLWR